MSFEMKEFSDAFDAMDKEIKTHIAKADEEIKSHGTMHAETKSALEAMKDRLRDVEQKVARRGVGGDSTAGKSLGEQFTESDDFKALQSKGRGVASMQIKANTITSLTTDAAGSVGDALQPHRIPGVLEPAQRVMTIRDALMPGQVSTDSIEDVRETGFTNAAAVKAETSDSQQSDLKFELFTTPVRTISHWFAASRQVLSDIPLLQSYINTRAIYGLKYAEETELLSGDGTGQHLTGLLASATAFSEANSVAGDTKIDTIRRAALQVRVAELRPTFIVLHPNDVADLELTKDKDERYVMSVTVPTGGVPQIWRLAVIETTVMSPNQFLVGAREGATVFDRMQSTIEVSLDHSDYFIKGLAAIKADERLALVTRRPESFVYGSFELGTSPSINVA